MCTFQFERVERTSGSRSEFVARTATPYGLPFDGERFNLYHSVRPRTVDARRMIVMRTVMPSTVSGKKRDEKTSAKKKVKLVSRPLFWVGFGLEGFKLFFLLIQLCEKFWTFRKLTLYCFLFLLSNLRLCQTCIMYTYKCILVSYTYRTITILKRFMCKYY